MARIVKARIVKEGWWSFHPLTGKRTAVVPENWARQIESDAALLASAIIKNSIVAEGDKAQCLFCDMRQVRRAMHSSDCPVRLALQVANDAGYG